MPTGIGEKMQDTEQLNLWRSSFGVEYTDRNKIDPSLRLNAFKDILSDLKIKNILEVGCNVGHNLISISKLGRFNLVGVEPLSYAIEKGREMSNKIAILEGDAFNLPFKDGYFDLVFTAGVLIHIHSKDLGKAIDEMYRVSKKYILIIEYFADEETVISYHGSMNALWKRNFEKIFLNKYPKLKKMKSGFLDKDQGFDKCNFILFEKP